MIFKLRFLLSHVSYISFLLLSVIQFFLKVSNVGVEIRMVVMEKWTIPNAVNNAKMIICPVDPIGGYLFTHGEITL